MQGHTFGKKGCQSSRRSVQILRHMQLFPLHVHSGPCLFRRDLQHPHLGVLTRAVRPPELPCWGSFPQDLWLQRGHLERPRSPGLTLQRCLFIKPEC